jgi:aminoglycoside 3-N-acetyltransferase
MSEGTEAQSMRDFTVKPQDIVPGLREVGLKEGGVALVHSAMRTFGRIEGGAETVVAALLEVLGKAGTLVVPTFTFRHEVESDPIIDPQTDPSEMGIITETVRRRPDALRSVGFRHSFAAIGRRAEVITGVDPRLSAFDLRSAFGVMLALNTQVLLLGVTYSSSTSHHFAEWVCDVPYRHKIPLKVKLRREDGLVVEQMMTDYQPLSDLPGSYYGTRSTDFNRLGKMLEERGLVGVTAIGNALARRFAMRDLIDLAQAEAAKDCNVFRTEEGQTDYEDYTDLSFGKIILSEELLDGAGRLDRFQWSVVDEAMLYKKGIRSQPDVGE